MSFDEAIQKIAERVEKSVGVRILAVSDEEEGAKVREAIFIALFDESPVVKTLVGDARTIVEEWEKVAEDLKQLLMKDVRKQSFITPQLCLN